MTEISYVRNWVVSGLSGLRFSDVESGHSVNEPSSWRAKSGEVSDLYPTLLTGLVLSVHFFFAGLMPFTIEHFIDLRSSLLIRY